MAALTPWIWIGLGALLTLLWLVVWEIVMYRLPGRTRPPDTAVRRLETTTAQGDELRKLCETLAEAREETR